MGLAKANMIFFLMIFLVELNTLFCLFKENKKKGELFYSIQQNEISLSNRKLRWQIVRKVLHEG